MDNNGNTRRCYHEAGHAFTYITLGIRVVRYESYEDRACIVVDRFSEQQYLCGALKQDPLGAQKMKLFTLLSGIASESIISGQEEWIDDEEKFLETIENVFGPDTSANDILSNSTYKMVIDAGEDLSEVIDYLNEYTQAVRLSTIRESLCSLKSMLKTNWETITRLANIFMKNSTVNDLSIYAVMENKTA